MDGDTQQSNVPTSQVQASSDKTMTKKSLNPHDGKPDGSEPDFSPRSALDDIVTSSTRLRQQENSVKSRSQRLMGEVDAHQELYSSVDNIMNMRGPMEQNTHAMDLKNIRSMLGINPS